MKKIRRVGAKETKREKGFKERVVRSIVCSEKSNKKSSEKYG